MDTLEVLEAIKDVASRIIQPRFKQLDSDQIMEKNPGDLVTVADREAEVELTRILQDAFYGCAVVGEEAVSADPGVLNAVGHSDQLFVVDPVDGTKNFVAGRPEFGVMVAEMRGWEPVRSWIWQPEMETSWVAERGAGISRNGEAFTRPVVDRAPIVASSTPGDTAEGSDLVLQDTWWACAHDYPHLVAGTCDALIYRSTNPWDHVPGLVMLNEIGGVMRYASGQPYHGLRVEGGLYACANPDYSDLVHSVTQSLAGE